jgi:hypothetical protein
MGGGGGGIELWQPLKGVVAERSKGGGVWYGWRHVKNEGSGPDRWVVGSGPELAGVGRMEMRKEQD